MVYVSGEAEAWRWQPHCEIDDRVKLSTRHGSFRSKTMKVINLFMARAMLIHLLQ